ncbi:hypothetical protein HDU97_006899 [Phlyctochytrium planicorne]|nr:hypothetical protein HDU97_006899 [Phlyctochytrium planicorne]
MSTEHQQYLTIGNDGKPREPGPLTRLVNGDTNPFEQSFASQASAASATMTMTSGSFQDSITIPTTPHLTHPEHPSQHQQQPSSTAKTSRTAAKTMAKGALSRADRSHSFGSPTPSSEGSHQDNDEAYGSGSADGKKRKRDPTSEEGDNDEEKRKKFLERNRVAASKCRQKKKLWMQELEQKSTELSERNKELIATVGQLKEEVLLLKNQLLLHRKCRCNVIQNFIQSPQFNEYTKTEHHAIHS